MSRTTRLFNASVICPAQGEIPIVVRNISRRGLGARGVSGLLPGQRIEVRLGSEHIAAEIRWARRDSFGALLEREIDPSLFTFVGKDWGSVQRPMEPGHVFDQFRPVSDPRRPALKIR